MVSGATRSASSPPHPHRPDRPPDLQIGVPKLHHPSLFHSIYATSSRMRDSDFVLFFNGHMPEGNLPNINIPLPEFRFERSFEDSSNSHTLLQKSQTRLSYSGPHA